MAEVLSASCSASCGAPPCVVRLLRSHVAGKTAKSCVGRGLLKAGGGDRVRVRLESGGGEGVGAWCSFPHTTGAGGAALRVPYMMWKESGGGQGHRSPR